MNEELLFQLVNHNEHTIHKYYIKININEKWCDQSIEAVFKQQ